MVFENGIRTRIVGVAPGPQGTIDVGDQCDTVTGGHGHAPVDADSVFRGPGAQRPGEQHRRKLVADKTGDADG